MMCSKPYRQGVAEFGCGQCMPCRINRRRIWTCRLMLESHCHARSWFVTLTFAPEHLPVGVHPRDLQLFMKRVRKSIYPAKCRYYGVGEYGDISGRPHYHLIIFGVDDPQVFVDCWSFGHVHVGGVSAESCAYVVAYTLKGMTRRSDVRLNGRHPEFARMSLRPGIGAWSIMELLNALTTRGSAAAIAKLGDMPGRIRADGKMWPLGRYLLNKLRADYGMAVGGESAGFIKWVRELQLSLSEPGARDFREQKRLQAARRAFALFKIGQSKKGVGL